MQNVNRFPSSKLKLDEFFLNWLSSPESQKLVRPRPPPPALPRPSVASSCRVGHAIREISHPAFDVSHARRSPALPPPTISIL